MKVKGYMYPQMKKPVGMLQCIKVENVCSNFKRLYKALFGLRMVHYGNYVCSI
jgi:hypothetical protein